MLWNHNTGATTSGSYPDMFSNYEGGGGEHGDHGSDDGAGDGDVADIANGGNHGGVDGVGRDDGGEH